jgi:hypothetical protein
MRELTAAEKMVALELAKLVGSDAERTQLLLDIQNSTVEDVVPDGSMLTFHIAGYERPQPHGRDTFRGSDRFPVEGFVVDADGSDIDVLIFSDKNGRILELELVKHVGGSLLAPNWKSFKVK